MSCAPKTVRPSGTERERTGRSTLPTVTCWRISLPGLSYGCRTNRSGSRIGAQRGAPDPGPHRPVERRRQGLRLGLGRPTLAPTGGCSPAFPELKSPSRPGSASCPNAYPAPGNTEARGLRFLFRSFEQLFRPGRRALAPLDPRLTVKVQPLRRGPGSHSCAGQALIPAGPGSHSRKGRPSRRTRVVIHSNELSDTLAEYVIQIV